MKLFSKVVTALRGGARESLEVVIDANALRIMDQEIHDMETAINQSKYDLTQVVAEKIRLQREIGSLKKGMDNVERQALRALEDNQNDIANEHANWIADNEAILSDAERKHQQLEKHESDLRQQLKEFISKIQQYRREWRMVRATASSHSASQRIMRRNHQLGSHIGNIEESFLRIKSKQQAFVDLQSAHEQVDDALGDASLDLSPQRESTESILARVKEKHKLGCDTLV